MLTLDELDRMSKIGIDETNMTELVDITTISIDPLQSAVERMTRYLERVNNPYLFRCGDTAVRVRFEQDGKDLAGSLKNHFACLKMG